MTKEEKISIAEKRIKECEERRSYFVRSAEHSDTMTKALYIKMAECETESIDEIRAEIIKALLRK